jgi:hypothetical protein
MKKIFYFSLLTILIASCSNEINLTDTPKEIPVVHGFLSRADTAQYLRIEKVFLDAKISAPDLAKDAKNLYFDNISVELIDVEAKKTYNLTRVDGNLEGYKRTSGTFATAPNYLYKIKTDKLDLKENKTFKLVVKRSDKTILTEAQTIITPDLKLNQDRTNPNDLPFATGLVVGWLQSDYKTAKIYDIEMYANVKETDVNTGKSEKKRIYWNVIKGFLPGTTEITPQINAVQYRISDPFAFYKLMKNNLKVDKNIIRFLEGVDIEINSGGQELYEFQSIGNINSGITGTEVLPTYTNVKDGYGVLTSRNKLQYLDMKISARSLDSLRKGQFTKLLNFQ